TCPRRRGTIHRRSCALSFQVEQAQVLPGCLDVRDRVTAAVDALHDERQVVGLPLDRDAAEALDEARLDGGAGPGERLEAGAAGWSDEPEEQAHEVERFDGSRWGGPLRTHPRPPPRSSRADRRGSPPSRSHAYGITSI